MHRFGLESYGCYRNVTTTTRTHRQINVYENLREKKTNGILAKIKFRCERNWKCVCIPNLHLQPKMLLCSDGSRCMRPYKCRSIISRRVTLSESCRWLRCIYALCVCCFQFQTKISEYQGEANDSYWSLHGHSLPSAVSDFCCCSFVLSLYIYYKSITFFCARS